MRTRLGHYDIVAELGRGGMGVVYKGYEASLNRYVAIKVLADSLAHDEAIKERFLREARSMAALNDPHIIQIYFIGEDAGDRFGCADGANHPPRHRISWFGRDSEDDPRGALVGCQLGDRVHRFCSLGCGESIER